MPVRGPLLNLYIQGKGSMHVRGPVLYLYIQGEGSNACTGTCTIFVHSGRRE